MMRLIQRVHVAADASECLTSGPLGNPAKSVHRPPAQVEQQDRREAVRKSRSERFALLGVARRLLLNAGRAAGLEHPSDYHRTADCHHASLGSGVAIKRATEHGGAFYAGVATCGNVWACPVCAAKVQERRREEIATGIRWAYREGLQPVMVTLTFPHRSWHKLSALLTQQDDALKRLRRGRPWSRFIESVGYRGLIRSLEVTHGENGWHPHTHELWFVRADADAEAIRAEVAQQWESACARAGLLNMDDPAQVEAFRAHAVDVKGNCSASDYLAKQDDSRHWGADRELAKSSSKAGRAKGLHAFGLLADAAEGNSRAGRLFLAYVLAMKGRRQLFWSHGLKAVVGLDAKTDEEVAAEEREQSELLGVMTALEWESVVRAGLRAALLTAAERGGWPDVRRLLDAIVPPTDPPPPQPRE